MSPLKFDHLTENQSKVRHRNFQLRSQGLEGQQVREQEHLAPPRRDGERVLATKIAVTASTFARNSLIFKE